MLKVGDKVKILPTILSNYPNFPYVGVVGRVCAIDNDSDSIAVEFCILMSIFITVTGSLGSILAGIVVGKSWNLYLMIICQIFGNISNI